MKKIVMLLTLAAVVSAFCAGCTGKEPGIQPDPAGEIEESPAGDKSSQPPSGGVDYDLTQMDSAAAYELALDFMLGGDYMGKTAKLSGAYAYIEYNDKYLHHAVVTDEQACCAAFVEFIWVGDYTFPDDYPGENTVIEISGVIKSYYDEEIDWTSYYLEVDGITDTGVADSSYLEWSA